MSSSGRMLIVGSGIVTAILMTVGCASIINGRKQTVPVNTLPSDVGVKVFDRQGQLVGAGSTPCSLILNRGDGYFRAARYRVLLEKDGYAARETTLNGCVDKADYLFGNLVFLGGVFGWFIVDPQTGAMWDLSPPEVAVELKTNQVGHAQADEPGDSVENSEPNK